MLYSRSLFLALSSTTSSKLGLKISAFAFKYLRALSSNYQAPINVSLNYQVPPPPGKQTGRYVNQEAKDDVVDEITPATVKV